MLLANFANYRCTTYAGFHSVFTSEPVQFTQRTRWQFPLFLSGTTVDGNDPGRTPKERPQSPRTFALLLIKRATALLTPQLTTIIKHNNRHRIHLIKSSFILRHHRAHYSPPLSLSFRRQPVCIRCCTLLPSHCNNNLLTTTTTANNDEKEVEVKKNRRERLRQRSNRTHKSARDIELRKTIPSLSLSLSQLCSFGKSGSLCVLFCSLSPRL